MATSREILAGLSLWLREEAAPRLLEYDVSVLPLLGADISSVTELREAERILKAALARAIEHLLEPAELIILDWVRQDIDWYWIFLGDPRRSSGEGPWHIYRLQMALIDSLGEGPIPSFSILLSEWLRNEVAPLFREFGEEEQARWLEEQNIFLYGYVVEAFRTLQEELHREYISTYGVRRALDSLFLVVAGERYMPISTQAQYAKEIMPLLRSAFFLLYGDPK